MVRQSNCGGGALRQKNFRKFERFQLRFFGTLEPGIWNKIYFQIVWIMEAWTKKNRPIEGDKILLNFDFYLPCRTSPRRCSLGSPGGWFWNLFTTKLGWLINKWLRYLTFWAKERRRKKTNHRSFKISEFET